MPSVWRKTGGNWIKIKTIYRKTGGSWQSVRRVWRKTAGAWQLVFQQATTPSIQSQVEIGISVANTTTQTRRLTGTLYHWTNATGVTYRFTKSTDGTSFSNITGASGTSTNPASGSSNTNDQYVLTQSDMVANTTNYFNYVSTATNSTFGTEQTSTALSPVTFEMPRDVTIATDTITGSSVKITWTATTGSGSYVVYYGTATSPTTVGATVTGNNATITGLTSGTLYYFRVRPFTGSSGNGYFGNYSNEVTATTKTVYKFAFGDQLHVSTNGYIGIGSGSANGSDSIPTSGRYLAVVARDLQQSTNNSIWYWSDTSKYTIRWEGYDYGNPSNAKTYQVIFYKDQSYADVLVIEATGGSGSTTAYQEDGTIVSTYASALTTGQQRRVYFDGTTTASVTVTAQAKTSMKQVSGLTSGTTDIGFTTLTSATNQNSFTAGTVKVTGGSTETSNGSVTRGVNLAISTADWPTGTTFTYQWYRTRNIEGIAPIALGTASTQSSTTIGEELYCVVKYSNSSYGLTDVTWGTTFSYVIVPAAPSYTLTNNSNGSFTISSVSSTGASGYFGTYKVGTGSNVNIASESSPTAIATNSTINSGAGSVSVTLFATVVINYSGYSVRRTSWESTTNSVTVTAAASGPTVTSISYIPLGNLGTQYTPSSSNFTGSQDDGYWTFNLPFSLKYNGTTYNTIYVGTNSYITLGGGSTAFSSLSATNPAFNKVMVYAADRSSNSCYFYSTSSVWNIKLNCGSTSGTPGTAIQWEAYGVSGNTDRLDITIVAGSGGTTGAYTSNSLINGLGGNGTAWRITSQ